MTIRIYPTVNDVNEGGATTEINTASWNLAGAGVQASFVSEGLLPTQSNPLVVSVAPGAAIIGGYLVRLDTPSAVTVNASESSQHWYLQLVKSGSLVTGTQWVRVLSPAVDGSDDPSDAVKIFGVDTTSTFISGGSDFRRGHGVRIGHYTGLDTTVVVTLPFTPVWVWVQGAGLSAPSDEITGISRVFQAGVTLGAFIDATTVSTTPETYRRPKIERKTITGGGLTGFTVAHNFSNPNLSDSGFPLPNNYAYLAVM